MHVDEQFNPCLLNYLSCNVDFRTSNSGALIPFSVISKARRESGQKRGSLKGVTSLEHVRDVWVVNHRTFCRPCGVLVDQWVARPADADLVARVLRV